LKGLWQPRQRRRAGPRCARRAHQQCTTVQFTS